MGISIDELVQKIDAETVGATNLDRTVNGVYCCDLLSRVLSNAEAGNAWITVHTHINIVAVALLTEVSCVIIPEGIEVEAATAKKSKEEGVTILSTGLSTFEICVRMDNAFSEKSR